MEVVSFLLLFVNKFGDTVMEDGSFYMSLEALFLFFLLYRNVTIILCRAETNSLIFEKLFIILLAVFE